MNKITNHGQVILILDQTLSKIKIISWHNIKWFCTIDSTKLEDCVERLKVK